MLLFTLIHAEGYLHFCCIFSFIWLYFVAEEIDGNCLQDLTAPVLYQMGMKMGVALKIQRIVANLKVIVFLCVCLIVVD